MEGAWNGVRRCSPRPGCWKILGFIGICSAETGDLLLVLPGVFLIIFTVELTTPDH